MNSSSPNRIFYLLIGSQFLGTSLWFAGNAVLPQLQSLYQWRSESLGYLTSSVQLGFIIGTLVLAVSGLSDRFSPSLIFFISSILGASANFLCIVDVSSFGLVLSTRFLTGFFLAGIYPVGMKIAADYREQGLGSWLGYLVGALTVGTAFPHALKLFPDFLKPEILLASVSVLAATGGTLVLFFIPNGPFRKISTGFSFASVSKVFKLSEFQSAAFGYFGHMWELYAFWAFVPWIILSYNDIYHANLNTSFWSFAIIGAGAIGCVVGGYVSQRWSSKGVATIALVSSGVCCCMALFLFSFTEILFLMVMIFWGFMVVADSPQFSALVANNAPREIRGSAITITTCIGFTITIFSIQLLTIIREMWPPGLVLFVLAAGPVFGVFSLLKKSKRNSVSA